MRSIPGGGADAAACHPGFESGASRRADRPLAVDDVSLEVGRNEIVCIVGESGSGKSLTAHAVMGLLHAVVTATGGRLFLMAPICCKEPPERCASGVGRDIAMIFQDRCGAEPVVAIGKQVTEQIRAHRVLQKVWR